MVPQQEPMPSRSSAQSTTRHQARLLLPPLLPPLTRPLPSTTRLRLLSTTRLLLRTTPTMTRSPTPLLQLLHRHRHPRLLRQPSAERLLSASCAASTCNAMNYCDIFQTHGRSSLRLSCFMSLLTLAFPSSCSTLPTMSLLTSGLLLLTLIILYSSPASGTTLKPLRI